MRILSILLVLLATVVVSVGCRRNADVATPPPPPPPPTAWLPADGADVAQLLASEAVKRPWINEFRDHTARVPVLRIGTIDNRSDGEVDIQQFSSDLATAFGAHASLRVAGPEVNPADYTLVGAVSFSEKDRGATRYYQLDFRILDARGDTVGAPFALERVKSAIPPAANP